MKWKLFLMAALIAFAALACASRQEVHGPKADLAGTNWKLMGIKGQAIEPASGSKEPNLVIGAGKDTASGFAGCNSFTGKVEVQGSRIAFGPLASTRMMCRDMTVEDGYFQALAAVDAWSVRDQTLLLKKGNEILLQFEAVYLP